MRAQERCGKALFVCSVKYPLSDVLIPCFKAEVGPGLGREGKNHIHSFVTKNGISVWFFLFFLRILKSELSIFTLGQKCRHIYVAVASGIFMAFTFMQNCINVYLKKLSWKHNNYSLSASGVPEALHFHAAVVSNTMTSRGIWI